MIAANQAQAFMNKSAIVFDENLTQADTIYQLDSYKIGKGSQVLPVGNQIATAAVKINSNTNKLQLTLERRYFCPEGSICTMQMPAPVSITLPLVYVGNPFCGGTMMVAEKNLPSGYFKVQVLDENGPSCQDNADDTTFSKRVIVTITEKAADSDKIVVSQMSGFPEQL